MAKKTYFFGMCFLISAVFTLLLIFLNLFIFTGEKLLTTLAFFSYLPTLISGISYENIRNKFLKLDDLVCYERSLISNIFEENELMINGDNDLKYAKAIISSNSSVNNLGNSNNSLGNKVKTKIRKLCKYK